MASMLQDLLDVVLPTSCAGCEVPLRDRGGSRLCQECTRSIPGGLWPLQVEGLDATWGWAPYEGPVGNALRRGKYRPDPAVLRELGRRMAAIVRAGVGEMDHLVPVPRSWQDLLRTGLEPTSVLAAPVAQALSRPLSRSLRRRGGPPQAALPGERRRENVRDAFRAKAVIPGSRVLLFDDVITTGATARACAEVLRASGARQVALLTVCSPLL